MPEMELDEKALEDALAIFAQDCAYHRAEGCTIPDACRCIETTELIVLAYMESAGLVSVPVIGRK